MTRASFVAIAIVVLLSTACVSSTTPEGGAATTEKRDAGPPAGERVDSAPSEWTQDAPWLRDATAPIVAAGNAVVAAEGPGSVIGLDAATGERRWAVAADGDLASPVGVLAVDDRSVLVTDKATVRLVSSRTGDVRWTKPVSEVVVIGGDVAADDDLLVLTSDHGPVALDRATGKVRWRAQQISLNMSSETRGFAMGIDDHAIYLIALNYDAGASPTAMALNRQDGTQLWRTPMPGPAAGMKLIRDTVVVHLASGEVVALPRDTGKAKWTAKPSTRTPDVPMQLYNNGDEAIAWSDARGGLGALSLVDGHTIWTRELGRTVRLPPPDCRACGRRDLGPGFAVYAPPTWQVLSPATGDEVHGEADATFIPGLNDASTNTWMVVPATTDGNRLVLRSFVTGGPPSPPPSTGGTTAPPATDAPFMLAIDDDLRIIIQPMSLIEGLPNITRYSLSRSTEIEPVLRQELAASGYDAELLAHVRTQGEQAWEGTYEPTEAGPSAMNEVIYRYAVLDEPVPTNGLLPLYHDSVSLPPVREQDVPGIPQGKLAVWTQEQVDGALVRITSVRFRCSNVTARLEIRRTDLDLDVTKSAVALAGLAYDQVKIVANRVCQ